MLNCQEKVTKENGNPEEPSKAGKISGLAGAAFERTRAVAQGAADLGTAAAKKVGGAATSAASAFKSGTKKAAVKGLETLLDDPEIPPSLASKLVRFGPLIAASKRYANAWDSYHTALAKGDEDGIKKSQVECLKALQEGGIELSLYAVMKFGKVAAAGATLTGWVSSFKLIKRLDNAKESVTGFVARKLLDNQLINNLTLKVFSALEPSRKKEPPAV